MPTGYTAPIHDGQPITFSQFALRCARAFGALVMLRDEGLDAPVPEKLVPDDYHEKAITEAKAALRAAQEMTPAEAERAAGDHFTEETDRYSATIQRDVELAQRYQQMLARVEAWQPPTSEHHGLKRFMIEQIAVSLKCDCGYKPPQPTRLSGEAYRQSLIEKARRDIAYHENELEAERERTAGRNAWLKSLRASLPNE